MLDTLVNLDVYFKSRDFAARLGQPVESDDMFEIADKINNTIQQENAETVRVRCTRWAI